VSPAIKIDYAKQKIKPGLLSLLTVCYYLLQLIEPGREIEIFSTGVGSGKKQVV